MATFSVKPTEGQDPWGATDLAWRGSVEAAVNASEVTIDKSAGIKVSVQDNAAGRKQLIYADTGMRDISALLPGWSFAGASNHARLWRTGYGVHISILGTFNSAGNLSLPSGFHSSEGPGRAHFVRNAGGALSAVSALMHGSVLWIDGLAVGQEYSLKLHYRTNQAWPASLPGAAVDIIPNA